jgi:hypothetical protein
MTSHCARHSESLCAQTLVVADVFVLFFVVGMIALSVWYGLR